MSSKLFLDYFEIQNNQRIFAAMGLTEFKLDGLADKRLVGIIGDNGSGKTTLLKEFQPIAIYNYIENKIGRKIFIYKSSDNTVSYKFDFVFEPKGDNNHSCKIYVFKIDLITGITEELNSNGGYNSGIEKIGNILGYTSATEPLYYMSLKELFFTNKTFSERLVFVQKIINGLENLKQLSMNIADKNRHLNSVMKATAKKLEGLGDLVLYENQLKEHEARLLECENTLEELTTSIAKMNVTEESVIKMENSVNIFKKQLEDITSIIMSFYIKHYNGNKDFSFLDLKNKIKYEIDNIEFNNKKLLEEILSIENLLANIKMRDKITVDYTESEYNSLERYFSDYTKEDLNKINTYSIDEIYHVKNMINDITHTINKMRFDIFDFNDILANDETSVMNINASLFIRARELKDERAQLNEMITKSNVVVELSKLVDVNKSGCRECRVVERIFELDSDNDILVSRINSITEELEQLKYKAEYNELLIEVSGIYRKARDFYVSHSELIRKYISDFNFEDVIMRGNTDSLQFEIAQRSNEFNNNIRLMKIRESAKYEKVISEFQNNDIQTKKEKLESMKATLDANNKYLSEIVAKKSEMSALLSSLDVTKKGYDLMDYLNYTYTRLSSEVHGLKEQIGRMVGLLEEEKRKLELLKNQDITKMALKNEIVSKKDMINSIRDKVGSIRLLSSDMDKYGVLAEELAIVHNVTSKKLFSKVIKAFMNGLRDRANNFLEASKLQYRVEQPIIDENEFKIPILKLETGIQANDISMMSSGEEATNGMVLSMSCQDMMDIPYTTVCIDEVDGPLSVKNRVEFMSIIDRCSVEDGKQIFCVSHGDNFSMIKDNLSLIVLKGEKAIEGVNILYDYNQ